MRNIFIALALAVISSGASAACYQFGDHLPREINGYKLKSLAERVCVDPSANRKYWDIRLYGQTGPLASFNAVQDYGNGNKDERVFRVTSATQEGRIVNYYNQMEILLESKFEDVSLLTFKNGPTVEGYYIHSEN